MTPQEKRRYRQDVFLAFLIGFLVGALLLAFAIPPDAWGVAWRFRGPGG